MKCKLKLNVSFDIRWWLHSLYAIVVYRDTGYREIRLLNIMALYSVDISFAVILMENIRSEWVSVCVCVGSCVDNTAYYVCNMYNCICTVSHLSHNTSKWK